MRRAETFAGVLAVLLLAGCATCPPMDAAWYRHEAQREPDAQRGPPTMLLALVHRGDRTAALESIVVNPTHSVGRGGWSFDPVEPLALQPGEVTVVRFDDFRNDRRDTMPSCVLPVAVALHCRGGSWPAWADVGGALPSHLPYEWVKACDAKSKGEKR